MAPPAAASADRVIEPFAASAGPADQVAAMDRQTAAMQALVEQIKGAREDFKPAADAVHGLGQAQAKFCDFIVNNRVKILGGALAGLAAVGAISPNLANVIGAVLKTWGVQ